MVDRQEKHTNTETQQPLGRKSKRKQEGESRLCFLLSGLCLAEEEAGRRGGGMKERWTDLEETGGELLQLLAELVSDFRQPLTLLILQQQLLTHTYMTPHKQKTTEKTKQKMNAWRQK